MDNTGNEPKSESSEVTAFIIISGWVLSLSSSRMSVLSFPIHLPPCSFHYATGGTK